MKKVLIISPYFPPSNAADMQRVRMSLPYFRDFGWETEVVSVDPKYSDIVKDPLLQESIPEDIPVHLVDAFSKKWTSKLGLGSIALRSLWFYKRKVNRILKEEKFDLIYFSTTQFPVCILGPYWKKRFGIPYVIDMQDPWHSDYYRDKPKSLRPPKYWFSYRLNKWLEPIAMKNAGGLISVSADYIQNLKARYPEIKHLTEAVITFGAFSKDFEIAEKYSRTLSTPVKCQVGKINIVYTGRGGADMATAVELLFTAMQNGLKQQPALFEKFVFYFIGTSYATSGKGMRSIHPIAERMGLGKYVYEFTDRNGFYEPILSIQKADVLFIPGSDDPKYTASKLYPYLMSGKAILPVFHEKSSAVKILKLCSPDTHVFTFPGNAKDISFEISALMARWASGSIRESNINQEAFQNYSAGTMTQMQCALFNKIT